MASLNHFPSAFETAVKNNFFYQQIPNHSGSNSHSSFAYKRLNAGNALLLRISGRTVCCRNELGSSSSRRGGGMRDWMVMRVNSIGILADYDDGGDDDDEMDDVLQATVAKSKKVLAVQRELLNQIAERKKLVSDIKSSILSENGDENVGNLDSASSDRNGFDDVGGPDNAFTSIGADEIRKDLFTGEDTSVNVNSLKNPDYSAKETFYRNKNDPMTIEDTMETTPQNVHRDAKGLNREEGEKPPPLAGANVMNIILVALECAPWIKTGGLGDVAGALPKALARRGHRVMVVVPRYGDYSEPQHTGIRRMYKIDGQDMEVAYFQTFIDGVDFVFIDSPIFRHIENNIYGGNRVDILKRMVLFCKAAVEVPWYVPCGGVCYGDGNLVFIANDWHTSLLPVYLKAYYRDRGLMQYTRSVLVIHNIAHQGRGPVNDFPIVDLPNHYMDLFRVNDPIGGEHLNVFAAGLKMADRIVTVSQSYVWELKTPEGGWGLHGIINENEWKLTGIINGIDTKDWNPTSDIHLQTDNYTNYSVDTLHTGKPRCKKALQKELGLPVRENVPLIGFIGRLDQQKGVDLIAEAIPWLMSQDVQLVMLGTGRTDLEQMLRQFENDYHDRIRSWVGFSVRTAHRITAGADILLMPSRFEPCGLNQLYAMVYGTVPVVHSVGGLKDTVSPFNPYGGETGFGWTFNKAEVNELINAVGNCLLTYRDYKTSWEGIQKRGMKQDLSWDSAAKNYEDVLVAAKYQW